MVRLNKDAVELLVYSSYVTGDDASCCFGKYYHNLHEMGLVTEEMNLTPYGKSFAKHCVKRGGVNPEYVMKKWGNVRKDS